MSTALVTGATGFVGSHLVDALLRRGDDVRCIVRRTSNTARLRGLRVELIEAELSDLPRIRKAAHGCDVVYHVAGKTFARSRDELYQANVLGSEIVAQACADQHAPPTLVAVSSLAAAGTATAGVPRRESDDCRPISHYGHSKRGGEMAVARWSGAVPVSIIRPAIVFGPRDREMLVMFQSIRRCHVHLVPGFTPRRVTLIHIDDLVEIMMRVADRGKRLSSSSAAKPGDGWYFASTSDQPTYIELGRMIAHAVEQPRLMIIPVAEPLAWLAAVVVQGIDSRQNRSRSFNVDKMREAFAGDWAASIRRLETELDFQFQKPLECRLKETAEWYREVGWI